MEKITKRLRSAMIVGCIVDAVMVLIFSVPILRIIIFGENSLYHTDLYEWAMRLVASVGAGWTLLLFWAALKPFERKDVLILTVFPLLLGSYLSTFLGYLAGAVSIQFLILFSIITLVHGPYFTYIWIKALGIGNQLNSPLKRIWAFPTQGGIVSVL